MFWALRTYTYVKKTHHWKTAFSVEYGPLKISYVKVLKGYHIKIFLNNNKNNNWKTAFNVLQRNV